jgi:hypothetical protein
MNQRNSPLLKLPAEVRNCIYEYAFARGSIDFMKDSASSDDSSPHTRKHQGASALIHVCRQVRHEALPIFYTNTTFHFSSLDRWLPALTRLGSNVYNPIRRIRVSEWAAEYMGHAYAVKQACGEDFLKSGASAHIRRAGLAPNVTFRALLSLEEVEIVRKLPPHLPEHTERFKKAAVDYTGNESLIFRLINKN